MKKLKIILPYKYLIIASIFVIYSLIYNNKQIGSKYNINEKQIYGYIEDYTISDLKLNITLKGKEKVLCKYEFKSKEESDIFIDTYSLGDYIKLNGTLSTPSNNTNFNMFNYKEYLKYEHVNYILNINSYEKLRNNKNILYKIKNIIIKKVNDNINYKYLYTFILGNSKYIDSDVMSSYRTNGISHLFAVSGMHVSLLSLVLLKVLKKFKYKDSLVIAVLLLYMFLTSFTPSILRAGVMFILLYINKKYKFNIRTIDIMYILLSILILIDPYIIYKVGFEFSYIISFCLIYFNKIISSCNNSIKSLFMISFISLIVSLPITVNNFYQINILSIILNIVFVPVISSIIFPLSIISLFITPLSYILKILITIFESMSVCFSKITILVINLPKMDIFIVIIYYLLSFYVLKGIMYKKYKRIMFLIFFIFIWSNISIFNNNLIINYMDVNQGDSIFIKIPYNKLNILIDTGGKETFNNDSKYSIVVNNTVPYFKSMGIKKLNYLIITHGDYDHMGEAINLVENFKVENVIFNCGSYNALEKKLIKVLEKKNINYYSCIKELNIDNYKLQFINTGEYDNENDNSSVIYFNYNNYKFLFMGDAGTQREKDILEKYNLKDIDFLKVGHHGSNTSSSEDFINSINPKYSLISVGKNNRYGHPKDEVLDILKNSKIYRTDLDGSIEIKLNKNGYKIRTCPP